MTEEPVYRITLVRHGESIGNAEGRLQGHADYPLSERGRAQVLALAERWKDEPIAFDHVIASPLCRALETGRILADAFGISRVETDPLWIEQDCGEPSGAEAGRLGESDEALYLRGGAALRSLLAHPPARYLIASHQAILNTVVCGILGIVPRPDSRDRVRFRMRNGSFSRFRYYPLARRWLVDVIADRGHWKGDE